MKNLTKAILGVSIAAAITTTGCLTRGSKEWITGSIKQEIAQHEQKSLRLLAEAFDSTYQVTNEPYYGTREGILIEGNTGSGSGILLKGGYLLTARNVVDESFPIGFSHPYWGFVTYVHNELSLRDKDSSYGLELILAGESRSLDYALLKLSEEDSKDLSLYSPGLNIPGKVVLGMRSAAVGYPLGTGRNLRLGNVSQIESDENENHLKFSNTITNDSGGPILTMENGDIKLTAIAAKLGYGLRVEAILKDMEEQLESGFLDEETAKQVEDFLKLNKISEN